MVPSVVPSVVSLNWHPLTKALYGASLKYSCPLYCKFVSFKLRVRVFYTAHFVSFKLQVRVFQTTSSCLLHCTVRVFYTANSCLLNHKFVAFKLRVRGLYTTP
jgi:hypothetical protein